MRPVTVNHATRALQTALDTAHNDLTCYVGLCDHGTPPPDLPVGVVPLVVRDRSAGRHRVHLVRYTRRRGGGYNVVRADNGRCLGWVVRASAGEHQGTWSVHVHSGAFLGVGPDDLGNLLDHVAPHLYGSTSGEEAFSPPVDRCDRRDDAAWTLVARLVDNRAPALGYPRHPLTRLYHHRPDMHYEMTCRDGLQCSCGQALPCPVRVELETGGR